MRFLHIADLHLGKRLSGVGLLDDQIHVLNQLARAAIAERVDAVLIAGDVYQRASPQAEAMSAFNDFVTALADAGIAVLVISGNHDSERRISYFASLLRSRGVYVSERFTGALQRVTLADEHGAVTFHLLPFVKPVTVRRLFPEESIESYTDAIRAVLARSPVDTAQRNVLLAHQFLTGAAVSESEERSVGGLDDIDAALFDAFDYAALGHLHRAQSVRRPCVRYAGSPLPYSFAEAGYAHGALLVELGAKGEVSWRAVPCAAPHPLREVAGLLAELLRLPYSEDYVRVTLCDEEPPPDARYALAAVFPNMLRFGVENSKTRTDAEVDWGEAMESRGVRELFGDFYRLQNNGASPTAEQLDALDEALAGWEERRHETD